MPYLTQDRKDELAQGVSPASPGDLNYLITRAALSHIEFGDAGVFVERVNEAVEKFIEANGKSYTTFNNAIGAIVCAGTEFARRSADADWTEEHEQVGDLLTDKLEHFYVTTVAPYEDEKINENGDVY